MTETPPTDEQSNSTPRWVWWIGGGLVIVLAGVGTLAYAYSTVGQRIVPAVTIAGQPVGRLDVLTATHLITDRWQQFSSAAFVFQAGDQTITISAGQPTGNETVVTLGVATFDPDQAVRRAFAFGRRGSFWQQLRERTSAWLGRRHEFGTEILDRSAIGQQLKDQLASSEQPAKNASLFIADDGSMAITPSTTGQTYDYQAAIRQAKRNLENLQAAKIVVHQVLVLPAVPTTPSLLALAQQAVPALLNRAPLTLTNQDKTWTITKKDLAGLLGFVGTAQAPRVGFDTEKTTTWLTKVATDVAVTSQNAKFVMVNNKVQEFQPSQVGVQLDVLATAQAMQRAFIDQQQTQVAIVTTQTQPLTNTVDTNSLGITELVASATTNFKGSPTNRRLNLTYGAQMLNGLLIEPGREFSLVKALGVIDGAHGWKPELVIIGTNITPEFGGGLCQVATTMFRVALNAGLPITDRHNHGLRIRYYEPPIGLDATMYDPQPDLRFINDYAGPLLLQTHVDGDNLTFEFYGTKDGRTVDLPTPKVFNQTAIPATQTTVVDTLKPGEKKCQAPGHPGADAIATYTVTKADGTKNTQVFRSHYQALGVICQVGRTPAPKPTPPAVTSVPATNTSIQVVNTNT